MTRFGKVQPVTGDIGSKQAEEKLKSIMDNRNSELNKAAQEAIKGLEALEELDKSRIPAGYFKSNFADSFQEMIDKNEANEEVVIDWLKIAGGGHREVLLVDDKNEVIDTVPAIFNNTPPLSPEDNSEAKEMTQAMLLAGEDGDSFHPLLDAEKDKLEYLSAIGEKLGAGILASEENALNSQKFKQVVGKYSNKLNTKELEDLKVDSKVKKVEEIEYDID